MMSDDEIWVVFAVVYSVPYFLWQNSALDTLKARQKLYPGRSENARTRRFLDRSSIAWTIGGFVGFAGWKFEVPVALCIPIITAGVLFTIWQYYQLSTAPEKNL